MLRPAERKSLSVSSARRRLPSLTNRAISARVISGSSAAKVIAIGGAWGTTAEIAFAKVLGRPVVALAGAPGVDGVQVAASPAEAVELALAGLG